MAEGLAKYLEEQGLTEGAQRLAEALMKATAADAAETQVCGQDAARGRRDRSRGGCSAP